MRNTRSRKGLASTVATVLMFFILFTVGTGYFIFVNGLNSQYSSNLQTAQRNLSGGLGESLKVTAVLLSSTGDLGFYVNNTASGSGSGNVTIAMVISPTGADLKCMGTSLTAWACASQSATFTLCSNASCSTTTSPSPNSLGVKAGKGSAVIDTGYVYPTGTTDTVRVVTNFGNAFAATYPTALTSQSSVSANTAQSLTINPSTFKWTTIQPSTSSVHQSNFASNCNSASCGAACTSSVTVGNTLVYALGWSGQSPPTTPTDTRGDTYVLGASQSVVYNPPSPSVVQSKYLAYCNSANCQLGYTSSVTAGNTLVYGLGWYGGVGNTYVPVTLTNSQAAATPNPFQQQVTWNPSTYSAYEASNLGNIRFCADTACATTLNAWLESCTASCIPTATSATAWVKLTSAITGSGGTLTIYMVFLSTSTAFDGNYWGEAPNIPGTYGTNDNGANVFGKYWNFAGASLPSGWTTTTGSPANNGLTISAGAVYTTPTQFASLNNVLESYFRITSSTATGYNGMSQANTQSPAGNNGGSNAELLYMTYGNVDTQMHAWAGNGAAATYNVQNFVSVFTPTVNQWYVISGWVSGTQVGEQSNYGAAVTASGTYNTNQYIIMGLFSGSTSGSTALTPAQYQWLRVRALAPSNVMPSTSFGGVAGGGNNPPSTPTDSLSDTFALGVSNSLAVTSGTPTHVQHNYLANCNAANCGLAFTSNVATGNILALGLGWSGQGPPSTPTDTRSNTFTLGASNSVTVGGAAPSLVQSKYASNCASTSCGAQFTSAVTTGNTLVFGLAWPTNSPPSTPTDTLGDTFALGVSNSVGVLA